MISYQTENMFPLSLYSPTDSHRRGRVRPEEDFERAATYLGVTEPEYLEKADVWPLNPDGELLITVAIESREGVANARAISAVPGVAIVTVGSGTLGGVFTSTGAEGVRVRDVATMPGRNGGRLNAGGTPGTAA